MDFTSSATHPPRRGERFLADQTVWEVFPILGHHPAHHIELVLRLACSISGSQHV